jgi:hypothetical protein
MEPVAKPNLFKRNPSCVRCADHSAGSRDARLIKVLALRFLVDPATVLDAVDDESDPFLSILPLAQVRQL